MMDITEIPALFRIVVLKAILAIDVFSRMPLAFKVTTAAAVTEVLLHAVQRHGAAPHLVTDQGSQFTSTTFAEAVAAVGASSDSGRWARWGRSPSSSDCSGP